VKEYLRQSDEQPPGLMKRAFITYCDGTEAHAGDTVKLSDGTYGTVVCVLDTDEYTREFPQDEWGYLHTGAMINTSTMGLVHYNQLDEDVEFVERHHEYEQPGT
jgi:hypothetical protein